MSLKDNMDALTKELYSIPVGETKTLKEFLRFHLPVMSVRSFLSKMIRKQRFNDIIDMIDDPYEYDEFSYTVFLLLLEREIPQLEKNQKVKEAFKFNFNIYPHVPKRNRELDYIIYRENDDLVRQKYLERVASILGDDYLIKSLREIGFFETQTVDDIVERFDWMVRTKGFYTVRQIAEQGLANKLSLPRSSKLFRKILETAIVEGTFGELWEDEVNKHPNFENEEEFIKMLSAILEDHGVQVQSVKEFTDGGLIVLSGGSIRGLTIKGPSLTIFGKTPNDKILSMKLSDFNYKKIDPLVSLVKKLVKGYRRTIIEDLYNWFVEMGSKGSFEVDDDNTFLVHKDLLYKPSGDYDFDEDILSYLEHGLMSNQRIATMVKFLASRFV